MRRPTFERWLALAGAACLLVAATARPALAIDAGGVDKLNKQALEAFDGLNFDQAKSLLEKAISDAGESGLGKDVSVARAHLNLGMVLIAGFQQRDEAIEHFKAALAIQPKIAPPAGVFNPETQAAFDEAKQSAASEREAQIAALAPARPARPAARVKKEARPEGEGEAEGAGEGGGLRGFYVAFGIGSGGGIARGNLDTNKNLLQMRPDGTKVLDNSWSGGFATSRLGHLTLDAGYFVSPNLLISLEGRLQFVSGTSEVVASPPSCPTSCSAPSTGIAVLGKASLFLLPGSVRPFVVGGLGGGAIRQVVKLNVKPDETDGVTTHCGSTGKDACVDTVTGGPFLIAAGGGVAYEVGSVAFLASLVSNIGIPHFMLNFDLTLGVGLRL